MFSFYSLKVSQILIVQCLHFNVLGFSVTKRLSAKNPFEWYDMNCFERGAIFKCNITGGTCQNVSAVEQTNHWQL